MNKTIKTSLLIMLFLVALFTLGAGGKDGSFSPHVDSQGNISLPDDFRATWTHLGTWALTSKVAAGPEAMKPSPGPGYQDVYTQPASVKAFKEPGKWRDDTVIVMEVRTIRWADLSTGHVMYAGEPAEWFVMVKDGQGRFKDNPSWGQGWGWALFKAGDPRKNISKSYKDCMGCHEPQKDTDWVHVGGYPTIR